MFLLIYSIIMRLSVIGTILLTRSSVRGFMIPWWTRYLKLGNPTSTISTSADAELPKLCINCKHYLPSDVHPSYGKCEKFILSDNVYYYVTGEGNKTNHHFCSVARSSPYMCDYNGTKFEEKAHIELFCNYTTKTDA